MTSRLSKILTAAVLPAALLISGCGDNGTAVNVPDTEPQTVSGFQLTRIATGSFFPSGMDDGMYKFTVPAKDAGTPNDLPCYLVGQSTTLQSGIGTFTCDFVAAHKPPQP